MSDVELSEELCKAKEALDRKTQAYIKSQETRALYKNLTPEEQYKKQMEKQREYSKSYSLANREKVLERNRRYNKEPRRQRKLQAEEQQPTQVFP